VSLTHSRTSASRLAVGVLASGRGSNLQALLDACAAPDFPARIVVVISDRERAAALDRARAAGVEAVWLNPKDYADRERFDLALVRELEKRQVGLVCQAGYMRILSAAYIRVFYGRALNVHPSLLPAFPGLHAQRQALEHGAKVTGATVHFADEGVDTGPIVLQAPVPVLADDTEETLSARILLEEHRLYPAAVRLFAEGRLEIAGRRVIIKDATREFR
jgi:phosphoribosylglycinamide formyltransferase-1